MSDDTVRNAVQAALREVVNPRTGRSVLDSDNVRALDVGAAGQVTLQLVVRAGEPDSLPAEVRAAVDQVEGVRSTTVDVLIPTAPAAGERGGEAPAGRSLPIMGAGGAQTAAAAVPADRGAAARHPSEASPLAGVRQVIAVSSGKGGVGKSTVSSNLAAALAAAGHRVGLMDADIYGPDIPTMFGVHEKPRMSEDRVLPLQAHGVKLMSLGFLVDEDTPAIWRGPIIMGVVRQFLEQVAWGELDYLVVDLPPGTGDAQLSLCQLVQVTGAVMVTTPQDVSVGGVLRGIRMFQKLEVPILGIVENMRGFVCPDCGSTHEIFGSGGGETLAASVDLPFLGAIPLGISVRQEGDRGVPTVVGRPESPEGRALLEMAEAAAAQLESKEGAKVDV
jgi:ATP-binding protein involved in chromosome partitioning